MSVKVRLKMKSCNLICEILLKQDFYLFQFKIANLFRNYLLILFYNKKDFLSSLSHQIVNLLKYRQIQTKRKHIKIINNKSC